MWTGAKGRSGHAQFSWNGKLTTASRFAYQFIKGDAGKQLENLCGKASCVNPDHWQVKEKKEIEPYVAPTPEERFWEKVIKTHNGCWEWQGAKGNKTAHGRFKVNGSLVGAHRYSYELAHGEIPDGAYICHKCDNPACVNPDHLYAGTPRDNVLDMLRRDRSTNVLLTKNKVKEIRQRYANGGITQKKLASVYNVSEHTISSVVNRITWNWI